jgi:mannose-6-phosphate isomerase-like protein (cupin superfamily)
LVRSRAGSPRRERDGLVSSILLQEGDVAGVGITATWVEVAAGSRQRLHDHPSEQVYVIVEGRGKMTVGDEERSVGAGDLVYIPSGARHGIENAADSGTRLVYVSAATPALDAGAAYDTGQLRSDAGDVR